MDKVPGGQTPEDRQRMREEFAAMPAFCTVKMYLNADGDIEGRLQFDFEDLKAKGTSKIKVAECKALAAMLGEQVQEAVTRMGLAASIMGARGEQDDERGEQTSQSASI